MAPAVVEHLVHAYVGGWRTGDRAKILYPCRVSVISYAT
jgi:hypothetical protein